MENDKYPITDIIEVLKSQKYIRTAKLLENSYYILNESSDLGSKSYSTLTTVGIYCSKGQYPELRALNKRKIISAFHALYPVKEGSIEIDQIEFYVDPKLMDLTKKENSKILQDEFFQTRTIMRQSLLEVLLSLDYIGGNLSLIEFLKLTWNLDEMPSTDSRFETAEEDIIQHMINNNDISWLELFRDYLKLMESENKVFFAFIESIVHFSVRKAEEQKKHASIINSYIEKEGYRLEIVKENFGCKIYKVIQIGSGVNKPIKNLIFAANGPKPEIVLDDAISNDILITKNSEYCLVYDLPIPSTGLLWKDMMAWWAEKQGITTITPDVGKKLADRLRLSLGFNSPPELLLFNTYFEVFYKELKEKLPALIPQVYLHYDPYTIKQLNGKPRLTRQRMDFLMLLSNQQRIVIEVDGKQHYSTDENRPDTKKYAEMVAADRELRLNGYEVYRFGGQELPENDSGKQVIIEFFQKLLEKHGVIGKG